MPDEAAAVATPPAETPQSAPQTPATPPEGAAPRTFTQDEVNAIAAAERRKALDSDEIKAARAAAKKLADLEASQKSAEEKLTERATAAEKLADERQGKYRTALIRSAFTTQAAAKGIPGDRIDAAFRLADLSAVEVDEATDAVSGVEKALAALPDWLAAPTRPGVPDINAGGGQPTVDQAARDAEIKRKFRLG